MAGWRTALQEQLRLLGRWTEGRFVPEVGPDDQWFEGTRYLDPEFLAETIDRSKVTSILARDPRAEDTVDRRAAASRITRLFSGFLTYVAQAGLAHGVGLDVSLAHC